MKSKILIYDDNCPLCTCYSRLFVKYGFLPAEGRQPFSTLSENLFSKIDPEKSRNEIPLIDTTTSKVLYGIDALLEILDQKIPFIKAIGNTRPINWMLKKLYKLISYNRKVIVAKKCGPGSIDCSPAINYPYRFVFMVLGLFFNTLMLYPIQHSIFNELSYYHLSFYELQAAHFTLVIINCGLALSFPKNKGYEYLGQVNMLALSAILLLAPLIMIGYFFSAEWFFSVWLAATALFIFKEYIRRMEYAGVLSSHKWLVSLNLLSLLGFILFIFHK